MKDYSFLGAKDILVVFDGKKVYKFPNERHLRDFQKKFFRKKDAKEKLVIIYEPTGPYSAFLEEFCAIKQIKVVSVNPRKVPRLREVLGHRAKNDNLDAELLYEYHDPSSKIVSALAIEDNLYH